MPNPERLTNLSSHREALPDQHLHDGHAQGEPAVRESRDTHPRPGASRGFRTPHRSAFTLLEILIVIGIIALLTTMAMIGFKVVGGISRNRVTATALENCKSLLANYKLTNQAENLLDDATMHRMIDTPAAINRWQSPAASGVAFDVVHCRASTPDVVASDGSTQASVDSRAINDRYLRDETARVIRRLTAVKENRTAIETMPPNRIEKIRVPLDPQQSIPAPSPSGSSPEYTGVPAGSYFDGVNLLDGDGHPIYFIPGGGLMWVNIGYTGTGDRTDKVNYDRQVLIRSADHGPFWVSPGPDGDLSTGDDNVYSDNVVAN